MGLPCSGGSALPSPEHKVPRHVRLPLQLGHHGAHHDGRALQEHGHGGHQLGAQLHGDVGAQAGGQLLGCGLGAGQGR